MQRYSQRYPAWANHPLGWGPALGTIGLYGCLETDFAMILTDTGHGLNPAALDDLLTQRQLFVKDSTGTFDLLPDNVLDLLFPGEYHTTHFPGFDGALIAQAVPLPDLYVILWISTATVPTHFVIAWSADGRYVADPWTGTVVALAAYGGPGAIHKTDLVTHIPHKLPPAVPAPIPGPPLPVPTPPIVDFYSFRTGDDTHPGDQTTTLADAMSLADDWSSVHDARAIQVVRYLSQPTGDDRAAQTEVAYDLPAGVVPKTN